MYVCMYVYANYMLCQLFFISLSYSTHGYNKHITYNSYLDYQDLSSNFQDRNKQLMKDKIPLSFSRHFEEPQRFLF